MMRLQIARSWDFNQMLVASVFGHLLLMTFVLFLPKTTIMEKIIPPAFMVELVEITQGDQKAVHKRPQKKKDPIKKPKKKVIPVPPKKAKPVPPAKKVKALTPIKPLAPPKSFEPIRQSIKMPLAKKQKVNRKSSDQILNSLERLNNSKAKPDKELSQLAKLVPTVSLDEPVIKKSRPIQEATFEEMNALKNKKAEVLPSKVEPSSDEIADNTKIDTRLKELEFASLSRNTVKLKSKQNEKSSADLLKELTEMKPAALDENESIAAQTPKVSAASVPEKSEAFDSILKKLNSLEEAKPEKNDTNIAATEQLAQSYQSDIRKVSAPQQVQVDVVISPNQAYVQSPIPGKPGADALALYKGLIIKKVMENWHAPLGQDHNKKVIISFNIYPKGNIDRPDLKESSRVELLDSLALRAIRESEPFPQFPDSLKSSNLNISIHFKYIPEKNKT